jgi:hypothetical protein
MTTSSILTSRSYSKKSSSFVSLQSRTTSFAQKGKCRLHTRRVQHRRPIILSLARKAASNCQIITNVITCSYQNLVTLSFLTQMTPQWKEPMLNPSQKRFLESFTQRHCTNGLHVLRSLSETLSESLLKRTPPH